MTARVRAEGDQHVLTIKVDTLERRGQWTPLIPDHGKMMHLFLIRSGEPNAFAHLHPAQRSGAEFEAPLPPLPAGRYHVYADVTHEDGFSETLTAAAEIPPASPVLKRLWLGNSAEPICSVAVAERLATSLVFPPDPDDSWQMDSAETGSSQQREHLSTNPAERAADASGGYKLIWENPGALVENLDASLRFKLLTPDNRPALIEPYMGMLGHAVVWRKDSAVFAHVHPVGTFSMAAQEFFVAGKPAKHAATNVPPGVFSVEPSSFGMGLHGNHTNAVGSVEALSFPYAFPEPGSYRIWIQTRSQGRILTGVFDTTVAAAQ